jgi:hypothetical protein
MAAPSFIQEAETAWNVSTSPKTTASFSVLAGDILIAFMGSEDNEPTPGSISGGSLTWTQEQSIDVLNFCGITIWSAVVDANKSMTVSVSRTLGSGTQKWGFNVLTFRGSDGVGASNKTNVASGAPTLNLTTTQANSAIVVANGDWAALTTARTWRANAGAFTENTYDTGGGSYTMYGGYHADAGAAGTYAVGLSAPTGQKYSIAAIEVKGTAGGAPDTSLPPLQTAVRWF